MKRSHRALAIAGVVGLFASLTACAGSNGGSSSDSLTIWTFKQSEVSALEAVGKEWTKQSGMPLKVSVYTPDDTYNTKIKSAAKSKTLPDIVSTHSQGEDWQFAQAGIIDDLTDDFDSSWQSEFLPGVMSGMELTDEKIQNSGDDPNTTLKDLKAGHYYSIPYLAGTPGVVFARTSMLEAAGVDTSKTPATWQEWVEDIKATVAKDSKNGGLVTGLQVPETGYFWLYRPMSYAYLGSDAFYGRQGKDADPKWNSAESIKTLDLYDQLTDLWSPGVLAMGIDQADQAFASGKAAWDVGGTFTLSSLTTFGLSAKDVQVFPVPAAEGGQIDKLSYQASPLIGAAITSTSKHKKEALDFIKYLTGKEGAATFAKTALDLPATAIPASDLTDPLLQQLVGLISTDEGGDAFAPNDFSADPAGTIGHDTAVTLSALVAKTSTVKQVANDLTTKYAAAWDALK
jgi:ABC-type glycerol-3-phosphate transport system substrate-binding protein